MTHSEHIAGDPVHVVTADRHCAKCRYNLRGLPKRGRCPECGQKVLSTLAFQRLERSSRLTAFVAAMWGLACLGALLWLCLASSLFAAFDPSAHDAAYAACGAVLAGAALLFLGVVFARRHVRARRSDVWLARVTRLLCSLPVAWLGFCVLEAAYILLYAGIEKGQSLTPNDGMLVRQAARFLMAVVPPALLAHAAVGMRLLRCAQAARRGLYCAYLLLLGGVCQFVWGLVRPLTTSQRLGVLDDLPLIWYVLYTGVAAYAVIWLVRSAIRLSRQLQRLV